MNMTIGVDTSGSISNKSLNSFFKELKKLNTQYKRPRWIKKGIHKIAIVVMEKK